MAILLMQLYQYREEMHRSQKRRGLRHVTIIEEAHRLLKRPPSGEGSGIANEGGRGVREHAAEIREYGEGWVIVDQVPRQSCYPTWSRTPARRFCTALRHATTHDTVGDSMGLTREQSDLVPRLSTGDAIFSH